jgi:hypothetical protein
MIIWALELVGLPICGRYGIRFRNWHEKQTHQAIQVVPLGIPFNVWHPVYL